MNDIAKKEPESMALAQVIERAAANPNVDMDKMERLLQMQERILDRNAKTDFADAMTHVQSKLPTVLRDATNQQTSSKYSRLETISKTIKPIYTEEGFSTSFTEGKSDKEGCVRICGTLMHRSGHSRDDYYVDIPLDDVGMKGNVNKTKTHATGSTFSYGRRYLTCMMFDVATGDDNDGNKPLTPITEQQAADIHALIDEVEADVPKFLKYFKIGSVEELSAQAFSHAVKMLEGKRK